jgi:DNA-binding response OmpR family regulator
LDIFQYIARYFSIAAMKLLIVEDELSLQEIMAMTLRKDGYVVETASTYREAMDKL